MNDTAAQIQIRAFREIPMSGKRLSEQGYASHVAATTRSRKASRSIALMAFLALASIFSAAAPARAESYPVCLAGGESNSLRCEYTNLEQCRATASGGLGYCVTNPVSAFDAYARYNNAARRLQ